MLSIACTLPKPDEMLAYEGMRYIEIQGTNSCWQFLTEVGNEPVLPTRHQDYILLATGDLQLRGRLEQHG